MNKLAFCFLILSIEFSACKNHQPGLFLDASGLSETSDSVQAGETIKRRLSISNSGNADLAIIDFSTSCDCTTIDLGNNFTLSPDSVRKIDILIATDSSEKNTTKRITVTFRSNDPNTFSSFSHDFYIY